jgi:3-phosphoshikimate 1-carboxyvinyltransferase
MIEPALQFRFKGQISSSKSILNRLLILKSYEPSLIITGDSRAEDVVKMQSALAQLLKGEVADCGAAGTTLRFLALRAARLPGHHHLSGSLRLFSRPQRELEKIMEQLGCQAEFGPQRLTIRGQGWVVPDGGLVIDRSISSQFASSLILNAWGLDQPLKVSFVGEPVSEGYLQMTLDLVRKAGMNYQVSESGEITIPAASKVSPGAFEVEPDLSSAFSIAALAALSGEAEIENWPEKSLQPDAVFPEFLQQMGCEIEKRSQSGSSLGSLVVRMPRQGALSPLAVDLRDCPDLFPVLATLCAFADGVSRLQGAPHLAYKESSRIEQTAELIRMIGRRAEEVRGGLEIHGSPHSKLTGSKASGVVDFDPVQDHRLAMAAALARLGGPPIRILKPEVVNKSFPEFWSILEKSGL